MIILKYLLCYIVLFLFVNLLFLILGLLFSKTVRFHKVGVRLLAMCMLVPGRYVSYRCHMNCQSTNCGNWTCEKYYYSKSETPALLKFADKVVKYLDYKQCDKCADNDSCPAASSGVVYPCPHFKRKKRYAASCGRPDPEP